MIGTLATVLTATAAVGAGVAGGVYLAFSAMVMPALREQPAAAAVATMQRINRHAVRPPFMAVFFGGALASAAVIAIELTSDPETAADPLRLVGAGLCLAGFGITVGRNVPLNNALDRIMPGSAVAEAGWEVFSGGWGPANHVRGAASIASAAVLLASLLRFD